MHMFKTLLAATFGLAALVSPASAEYPDKPIRMVVGYAPGGAADNRRRRCRARRREGRAGRAPRNRGCP
jgi:tripartite-type tricarboxylate transporter receptor subunit TctC